MEDETGHATHDQPQLSRREWQAVTVAMTDATRIGCAADSPPGPIGRIFNALTGAPRLRPLADPKLETLRRFVCATRRARKPAEQLVPALLEHGFNRAQVEALALLAA